MRRTFRCAGELSWPEATAGHDRVPVVGCVTSRLHAAAGEAQDLRMGDVGRLVEPDSDQGGDAGILERRASLTPSPVTATTWPRCRSATTMARFWVRV